MMSLCHSWLGIQPMDDMHLVMHEMNTSLDLNLLRVLDALLAERSVTKAARVLGRSQPAVSHALNRLRGALDDPLFVRQGRGLVPTPRAEQLGLSVRHTLAALSRALQAPPTFEPATTTRSFRLASPALLAPLLPDILHAMAEAPGARLELVGRTGAAGVDDADVVLDLIPETASGVVARSLGRLDSTVACRRDHPMLALPWTAQTWCSWPHILVRTRDGAASPVGIALEEVGLKRDIGLVVADLLLAPHIVARTDLLFTGPRQILVLLAPALGLELLEPPVPLPSPPIAAMWHERHQREPGHQWFRECVIGVFSDRMS